MDSWKKIQIFLLEKQIVHNFRIFQNVINDETWENHNKIFNWAESSLITDNKDARQ